MTDKLVEADVIYARAQRVECPHCDAEVDGWFGDPRGTETTCDECGKPFKIAASADVRLV